MIIEISVAKRKGLGERERERQFTKYTPVDNSPEVSVVMVFNVTGEPFIFQRLFLRFSLLICFCKFLFSSLKISFKRRRTSTMRPWYRWWMSVLLSWPASTMETNQLRLVYSLQVHCANSNRFVLSNLFFFYYQLAGCMCGSTMRMRECVCERETERKIEKASIQTNTVFSFSNITECQTVNVFAPLGQIFFMRFWALSLRWCCHLWMQWENNG